MTVTTNLTNTRDSKSTIPLRAEEAQNLSAPTNLADLALKDIIKTLPPECFQKNRRKAWLAVLLSVFTVSLGCVAIALVPWFLLPLAWVFTGTALTGFFVLGHDSAHRSFAQRRWVNDWVGHIMFLPLLYPFHSWRLLHDVHHNHTNKLHADNAWHPWTAEMYAAENRIVQEIYRFLRGRLWMLASILHWLLIHFDPSLVAPRDRNKMRFSITVIAVFAAVFFPTLIATMGIWGLVKFWLLPWLVFHFWMSTFTLIHHTDPEIPFLTSDRWNPVEAQLCGTVHCSYPRWVEILCHDINVHVPHHISVAIPFYNLRLAHASLSQNWGEYIRPERQFSWGFVFNIVDRCWIYDTEKPYQSHREFKSKA